MEAELPGHAFPGEAWERDKKSLDSSRDLTRCPGCRISVPCTVLLRQTRVPDRNGVDHTDVSARFRVKILIVAETKPTMGEGA